MSQNNIPDTTRSSASIPDNTNSGVLDAASHAIKTGISNFGRGGLAAVAYDDLKERFGGNK